MDSIRKVHDFLTVGAATPLQAAVVVALGFDDDYYLSLAADYAERRDAITEALTDAGFRCLVPSGAYYLMADISRFGFADDTAFVRHMIEATGVAAVPGSSFFWHSSLGSQLVRFCFCKKHETLDLARRQLSKMRET